MNIKKTTLAATLALGLLGAAHADLTIGVVLPLTGPGSGLGIPVKNQIALWPKTIAGETLKLVVLDDATDPTTGVKDAQRLVTEDKVDVIIGSAATPVAIPMADVAAESGTVQLAVSPAGLPPGKDKWTFRLPQSNDVMAYAVVQHMKTQKIKTIGFLGYSDAYGEL
ncbi:MAG TPA: ABC transporter substrate-binding protein, partial [Variovorax sp.]